MQLDVAADVGDAVGLGDPRGVAILGGHRLGDADAVLVARLERLVTSSPQNARLPNSAVPKRVPSSSMNEPTQIGRAGSKPSSRRIRIASTAASTPSTPSNAPPLGTVSRCEAVITAGPAGAGQRPSRLPAASISTSSPSRRNSSPTQAVTSASSGVHAKRLMPPSGTAPISAAAARSPASVRCGAGAASRAEPVGRVAPDRVGVALAGSP